MSHVRERSCTICRICDGPLVPAAFVATAADGVEWFECADCAALASIPEDPPVTLTPIDEPRNDTIPAPPWHLEEA